MSIASPTVRVVPERISALGIVWLCWTIECNRKLDPFVTDFEWNESSRAADFAAGYQTALDDLRAGRVRLREAPCGRAA